MAQARVSTTSNTSEGATAANDTRAAVSARILKKRETDRRCQRMIRERTKSRIAYLEGLVEQFRQQDASGRVETLMKQLSDVKEERDTLAKQVKNIESIISGTKLKEEPDTKDSTLVRSRSSDRGPLPAPSIDTQQAHQGALILNDDSVTSSPRDAPVYALHNKEYQAYIESSSRSSWSPSIMQPAPNQSCECSARHSAVNPTGTLNKWRYANDTLTEWFKWSPEALDMTKYAAFNDDVPVRAIVEGWDAVERQGHMHPAWRLLRGIDQNIFASCEPRERLAILTVMGLLLQAHINPTTEQHRKLPSFYLKRPSQDMLHSYATEYFAWPGLRERFIFSEHRYCANIFWRLFCKSLRVQWPYEFRDCYIHNVDTGLYKISPTFHARISDIRSWTMGVDMFKQYPELYGDIPAWNHIPASIAPIVGAMNATRRSLPSTPPIENTNKSINTNDQNQNQSHTPHSSRIAGPGQHHQPQTPQGGYYPYASSATSANFDAPSPLTFDFPTPGAVSTLSEMPVPNWPYHGSLDMYPLNPA